MIEIDLLKKVRIFEALDASQLSLLLDLLKPQSFKRGDYILKDESYGDMLYILVEGKDHKGDDRRQEKQQEDDHACTPIEFYSHSFNI